jgi:hypothetical protein
MIPRIVLPELRAGLVVRTEQLNPSDNGSPMATTSPMRASEIQLVHDKDRGVLTK